MKELRLTRWQLTTIATLTVGYAGYYICRSNLSVATPLLLAEFGDAGLDKKLMGDIASIGLIFYAAGKLFNGVLSDFVGGRRMFIFGMLASVAATILFGLGTGFAVFAVAWAINRAVQSMGWGALVKVASNWFPMKIHGTVMGILCLSYLFGDVFARLFLGTLLEMELGWRSVFFSAAGALGLIAVASMFLLKSSPAEVGDPVPEVNPSNLYGEGGSDERPSGILELLTPFVINPSFWLVCVVSFGLTVIRETFNFWTPTYLVEVGGLTDAQAAARSALFPLFGGFSLLAAGLLTDRLATGERGSVMFLFLLPVVPILFMLGRIEEGNSALSLTLISTTAFLIMGPYSFLTGVISLDLGGKKGSSTAAGLVDSVGYFGGIVSGRYVGKIAQDPARGWPGAFTMLAGVAALTLIACAAYWLMQRRRLRALTAGG